MIQVEKTLEVNAASAKVWSVLGRFMHIDEFHPRIEKVEALSEAQSGVGARRKCTFKDGSSAVEEVVGWQDGESYTFELSGFTVPLKKAVATLGVTPLGADRARLRMSMQYQVKYGVFGWLLGQTMMRMMMGKVFMVVLNGLHDRVLTGPKLVA